jgi:DNA-binding response OmpR family regulator
MNSIVNLVPGDKSVITTEADARRRSADAPRCAIACSARAEIPILLEVDAVRHRATRAGAKLKLTPKEFELLKFLAKHAGRVVTHN